MALANYTELGTAVTNWLGRSDQIARYDDWIALGEDRINNGDSGQFASPALRVREMETAATLTLSSGSAALPSDFLAAKRVRVNSSPIRVLTYATPDWYDEAYPDTTADDGVGFYTIIGSTLRSKASSTLELIYYAKVPALTAAAPTNWLLTKSPRAYLYATVLEGCLYLSDAERALEMGVLLKSTLNALQGADANSRAGRFERRANGQAP